MPDLQTREYTNRNTQTCVLGMSSTIIVNTKTLRLQYP